MPWTEAFYNLIRRVCSRCYRKRKSSLALSLRGFTPDFEQRGATPAPRILGLTATPSVTSIQVASGSWARGVGLVCLPRRPHFHSLALPKSQSFSASAPKSLLLVAIYSNQNAHLNGRLQCSHKQWILLINTFIYVFIKTFRWNISLNILRLLRYFEYVIWFL